MKQRLKRQWQKISGLLLAVLVLFSSTIQINAAQSEVLPNNIAVETDTVNRYIGAYSSEGKMARNVAIRTCSASLGISGSKASCSGMGSAYAAMASSVTLKMYLQKSGSSWTNVASWSTTENSTIATLNKTATVGNGTYRVKVICTAGGESVTVYSTTKTK